MIQALQEAKLLWNNPDELINQWDDDESKIRHEFLISDFISATAIPDTLVDLGCGVGRYSDVLEFSDYKGYDTSTEMIAKAIELRQGNGVAFSCVDIFNFSSDHTYDVAVMIDVAYHQNDPVGAILKILELWTATRYYFTLLVGDIREDLFNSTVVPFTDFLRINDKYNITKIYLERDDNKFAWVLLEIIP